MRAGTVAGLLEAIAVLAPELAGSSDAGAGAPGDRLADSTVAALRSSGLLRLGWPASLGGVEASTAEGVLVIEALAAVAPAAAWVCAVGSYHGGFAGAYAGEDAARHILGGPEDPIVSGQVSPAGRARPVPGGYLVSGRWSFASGVHHASWTISGVVLEGEEPRTLDVLVPVEQVDIVAGSWDVAGLEATGSCDYRMADVFVPEDYSFAFPTPQRRRGGPVFDVPVRAQVMVLHAGFPLGVARRALEEAARLARHKVRPLSEGPVAGRDTFRRDLGEAEARLAAARLYALDVAERLGTAARSGHTGPGLVAEARAASRLVTDVAVDVTTWAFRSGGGAALSRRGLLQQLLRDVLAAGQHAYVDEAAYGQLGATRLGTAEDG